MIGCESATSWMRKAWRQLVDLIMHRLCLPLYALQVVNGCSRLTDAAWGLIAQHGSSLQCLALESCGTAAAAAKSAAQRHAPMTAAAAVKALSSCNILLALTVRLCTAPWTAAAVDQLRAGCTALQSLCLDA